MHLARNYAWSLSFTDDELSVVQKLLRGDELTEIEDDEATRLSRVVDQVREIKESRLRDRTNNRSKRARVAT